MNHKLKLTYVDASDLEIETKITDPVKYHEAWRILCQCQGKLLMMSSLGLLGWQQIKVIYNNC